MATVTDDDTSAAYRLAYWATNNKGKLIGIFLFSSLFLIALSLFTRFALVQVEVMSSAETSGITVYASSDSGTSVAGGVGLLIVPRDTKSLIVSTNSGSVQSKLQIPWYGFVTKSVELTRDKNAEKIAFRSTTASTCVSYSPALERLSYFDCDNPVSLVWYNAPSTGRWSVKLLSLLSYPNQEALPYMGGVIGISSMYGGETPIPDITVVTSKGKKIYLKAPRNIDQVSLSQSRIVTDTSDPNNSRFVIVGRTGITYLATPNLQNKTVEYKEVPAPDNYNPVRNSTECTINDETVYCYRGVGAIGDSTIEGANLADFKPSVTVASFGGGSERNYEVIDLPVADEIYATNTGKLYAKSYKKLFYLEQKGDKLTPVELSQNVDSASAERNVYFVQDGSVYQVDDGTHNSHRLFYSPNVNVKAVYAADGKVFAIGSTYFDPSVTYAYKLTGDDNVFPGDRLIDLFPSESEIPEMVSNDLVGTTLSVQLNVPMRSQSAGEVAVRKTAVIDYLQSRGVPVDPNRIKFTY